jgi:hypothetical protein
MSPLFLGWDVGAWACTPRRSQDALVGLTGTSMSSLQLSGAPYWGNLRQALNTGPVPAILATSISASAERIVVAIDTPLGWPLEFQDLLTGKAVPATIPQASVANRLVHRETEAWLHRLGFRKPLSAVTDAIGSQSTKGMYFLRKGQLAVTTEGVWENEATSAIETYPAPVSTSPTLLPFFTRLLTSVLAQWGGNPKEKSDLEDALWCSLVAAAWSLTPSLLVKPPSPDPRIQTEGWIWFPNDVHPPSSKASKDKRRT